MTRPRALVRNAADPQQVKRAGQVQTDRDDRFLDAMRASLKYPEVRYVLGELLAHVDVYRTSLDANPHLVYFNEGRRSIGLEIRDACEKADDGLTELMEREYRARLRAENRATDASHKARAEDSDAEP